MVDVQRSREVTPIIQSSFSHPTVFKSILLVSFRRLLTSWKSAIRGLSVSEPELSISDTKPSLRDRRLKGKEKGVLGARETRGARPGPRVSLAPKTPFPFPSKRLPRRLSKPKSTTVFCGLYCYRQ